ncbi:protein translocase subunit SecD [Kitasatospora sp. NPDC048540]|uniref:protein translocase subunit SecD n=1 Tax=unclassified Kitasatospora TaxID=2633591 RepID=UPI000539BDB2|nr:protein translocase subunit SecD [Kitasatospora sp. MBT63]
MVATGHTKPKLGVDLAGGTSLTLTANPAESSAITPENMNTAVSILHKRVNGMGVSEAEVQTQGSRSIIINIPKGSNTQDAIDQVGKTAKLFFRPVLAEQAPGGAPGMGVPPASIKQQFDTIDCTDAAQRTDHQASPEADTVACAQDERSGAYAKYALGPVAVDGVDISKAQAAIDPSTNQWQVNLEFNGKGSKSFAATTGHLAQQDAPQNQFAIVMDGQVVSAPAVNGPIAGGNAQITGTFTQEQARDLASVLSYGALPLAFEKSDVTTVSPQLGGEQLHAGLLAGMVGLALVVLYSLAYYRGLGLVSVAGLAVSAALTYSVMSLLGASIGFALNLPAVCGAIVAIGITADSFIVYFERIRDEIREGAPLRSALQRAWPRARRTILVSDFVSFLAAAVLYFVTVGKVQGFAFTLGLTTLLDVVVIFLFTKPLMVLLARLKFFANGHKWSGLDPRSLNARTIRRSRRRPTEPTAEEA